MEFSQISHGEFNMGEILPGVGRLIGNVHLRPLPGAPSYDVALGMRGIIEQGVADALAYEEAGFDSLIVENAGDWPYLRERDLGPETASTMAVVSSAISAATSLPLGVICVSNAVTTSLAVCAAVEGSFVRVNQWIGSAISAEGWTDSRAGQWMRYRQLLGADAIRFLADVSVKHSAHSLMADVSLTQQAELAESAGADALIVTGKATGFPVRPEDVHVVKEATPLPVLLGSGVDNDTVAQLLGIADGAIIGSAAKIDGKWWNPVDPKRARQIVTAASAG